MACYAFRLPIKRVGMSYVPSRGSAAHPEFLSDLDPQDTFKRIDVFIKDFCGYAAEELAGWQDSDARLFDDKQDYENSMSMPIATGMVSRESESEFKQWLLTQARALIHKNWRAVQHFARVLIEKRQISGKEAVETCKRLKVGQRESKDASQIWTLP